MQGTRPMPPRHDPPTHAGLCLRALFLCFFSAFFALGALACGGKGNNPSPPPPQPSNEAGIQSIAVSKGALSPAYTALVDNYSVSLPVAANEMDITVILKDTKARLTIAGETAQSGVPRRVALDGLTMVNIVVIAEDALTDNRVRLNVMVTEANTKVWVLDSFGGTHPEGAKLTLTDTSGRVLASDIDFPAEKNGAKVLGLDPKGRYNIYAKANGSAQACFANFDPSRESTATLYCMRDGAAAFPSEAPVITDIHFSNQANSDWEKLPDGVNTLSSTADKMQYVKVTARAKSAITPADWGPVPINIMLDSPAWFENATPGSAVETAVQMVEGGQIYFRSAYRFAVPQMQSVTEKDHWLDIVVYDVANNRTETRVYLTVTDAPASSASDPNLAQTSPIIRSTQAQTYGISMEQSSIDPADPNHARDVDPSAINPIDDFGASYVTYMQFGVNGQVYTRQTNGYWDPYMGIDPLTMIDMTGIDFPGIRGFDVWRSDGNDRNFRKIDTIRYAQLNKGVRLLGYTVGAQYATITFGQAFAYVDAGPDVVEDVMHYRFRAFNSNPDGGVAPISNTVAVKPLPPFTTELTAPANGAVVDSIWPTFKFKVSNPAIVKGNVADSMVFTIWVKPTADTRLSLRATFIADFTDLDAGGRPRCYWTQNDGFSSRKYLATDDRTVNGKPYLWMEADGTFVFVADSVGFKWVNNLTGFNEPLQPGLSYEWSIFGSTSGLSFLNNVATNATYFHKAYQAPSGSTSEAFSFGSLSLYGYGSPNGFFRLTISPEATGNSGIEATE